MSISFNIQIYLKIINFGKFTHTPALCYAIGSADPNIVNTIQPTVLIPAAVLNTAGQLWVNSKICPAKYTPRKPGIAPTVFIKPKTLPEYDGAKSCGLTMTALLWKPVPPYENFSFYFFFC